MAKRNRYEDSLRTSNYTKADRSNLPTQPKKVLHFFEKLKSIFSFKSSKTHENPIIHNEPQSNCWDLPPDKRKEILENQAAVSKQFDPNSSKIIHNSNEERGQD